MRAVNKDWLCALLSGRLHWSFAAIDDVHWRWRPANLSGLVHDCSVGVITHDACRQTSGTSNSGCCCALCM